MHLRERIVEDFAQESESVLSTGNSYRSRELQFWPGKIYRYSDMSRV